MASYIVRFGPSEPRARELVGIFVADTVDQLFELVNETETPMCCEYRQLGNGGIYWEAAPGKPRRSTTGPTKPTAGSSCRLSRCSAPAGKLRCR